MAVAARGRFVCVCKTKQNGKRHNIRKRVKFDFFFFTSPSKTVKNTKYGIISLAVFLYVRHKTLHTNLHIEAPPKIPRNKKNMEVGSKISGLTLRVKEKLGLK